MNKRQRIADSEMRYLGAAWRAGYCGPSKHAQAPSLWQQIIQQIRPMRRQFDDDRVEALYQRWVNVGGQDRYSAAVLKLHYEDGYIFPDDQILAALDRFSLS